MTKDDMIRMVSAASGDGGVDELTGDAIERFYHLAVTAERRLCAHELAFNAQAISNGGDAYLAEVLWQMAEVMRTRSRP